MHGLSCFMYADLHAYYAFAILVNALVELHIVFYDSYESWFLCKHKLSRCLLGIFFCKNKKDFATSKAFHADGGT